MASFAFSPSPDKGNMALASNEIDVVLETVGPVTSEELFAFIASLEELARAIRLFGSEGFFEIVSIEEGSIILRLRAWHDRTTSARQTLAEYGTIAGLLLAIASCFPDEGQPATNSVEAPVAVPQNVRAISVTSRDNSITVNQSEPPIQGIKPKDYGPDAQPRLTPMGVPLVGWREGRMHRESGSSRVLFHDHATGEFLEMVDGHVPLDLCDDGRQVFVRFRPEKPDYYGPYRFETISGERPPGG